MSLETHKNSPFCGIRKKNGFTMVEAVVMLAIIVTISAVVLLSFGGLSEGANVSRSAQELALAIRRAQNMALAVTQVETPSGPTVPRAVGVYLARALPEKYYLFADLDRNFQYQQGVDAILAEEDLSRGSIINAITAYPDGVNPQTYSIAFIVFTKPEAAMNLTTVDGPDGDNRGDDIGERLEIEILGTRGVGFKKTLYLQSSGQITIK